MTDRRHEPENLPGLRHSHVRNILVRTPGMRRARIVLFGVAAALMEIATLSGLMVLLSQLGGAHTHHYDQIGLGALGRNEQNLFLLGAFALLVTSSAAVRLTAYKEAISWSFQYAADMAVEVHRRVLSQNLEYHSRTSSAALISAQEKIHSAVYTVALNVFQTIGTLCVSFGIVIFLLFISPFVTMVSAIIILAVYALVTLVVRQKITRAAVDTNSTFSARIKLLQETINGIKDIKLTHSEINVGNQLDAIEQSFARSRGMIAYLGHFPRIAVETILFLLIAGGALTFVTSKSGFGVDVATLAALALGSTRLVPMMHQVYQSWVLVRSSKMSMDDVEEILALPAHLQALAGADFPDDLRSGLSFSNVDFRYEGRDSLAIAGLSLNVPRGSRVAILGPSGSGKSTILDLAMGMICPHKGVITFGGTDISPHNAGAYWRKIAHVSQSIFLTDGTLRDNVAFGTEGIEISQKKLEDALRRARLDTFARSLPDACETMVGEGGMRLSGGQRQRLGIARALYQQRPLLFLDEAMSYLDQSTASQVLKEVLEERGAKIITLFTTHNIEDLKYADFVLELDQGRLVFFGEVITYIAENSK